MMKLLSQLKSKLTKTYFIQEFDRILAVLGITFSIITLIYIYKLGIVINTSGILYQIALILSLTCFLIWLLIRRKASLECNTLHSKYTQVLLIFLYSTLFLLSMLSIYFRDNLYERPMQYFILISLIVAIISIEILIFEEYMSIIILFQVIMVGVSLAWSQLLIFPALVGIDPWWHQMFTSIILNDHILPTGYEYSNLPIFHLYIAQFSLLSDLNYKYSAMLSVGISQIICNVLFVFLWGKIIFKNYRVGLFSSLLLMIANNHIYMSFWSIPNGFAAVFILPTLYLLVKTKKTKVNIMLSMLLFICIVFTHSITALFMSIALITFWVSFNCYNLISHTKKPPFSHFYLVLFNVTMLGVWTFISGHIVKLADFVKKSFAADELISANPIINIDNANKLLILEQVFNNIGMYLFFSLSIIGCLYMISKKYSNHFTFSIAITSVIPLIIAFYSLVFGRYIIVHRWFYFSQILLSVPLAVAIMIFYNKIKGNYTKITVISCLMILLSFSLIISPVANVDNHYYSKNTAVRYSLISSELQAIKTGDYMTNNAIKTDNYYAQTMSYSFKSKPFDNELRDNSLEDLKDNFVLIRKEIIDKPFIMYNTIYRLNYNILVKFEESNFSKIYDCDSVNGYHYENN